MKNLIIRFLDTYGTSIIIALLCLILLRSCSLNTSINKLTKESRLADSTSALHTAPTKEDIDRIISERLYDFLIFEDDLDKKKTSLSDIKLKISQNEKK